MTTGTIERTPPGADLPPPVDPFLARVDEHDGWRWNVRTVLLLILLVPLVAAALFFIFVVGPQTHSVWQTCPCAGG